MLFVNISLINCYYLLTLIKIKISKTFSDTKQLLLFFILKLLYAVLEYVGMLTYLIFNKVITMSVVRKRGFNNITYSSISR